MLENKTIVMIEGLKKYPDFLFVGLNFPEFKNKLKNTKVDEFYNQLRNGLYEYGLDKKNFNKKQWNPFKIYIKSGNTIVIKPNYVLDINRTGTIDSLITHTAYLKFILDYSILALNGNGKIVICDAPLQSCNFDNLIKLQKTDKLISLYKKEYSNIKFELLDLRKTVFEKNHFNISQKQKSGDKSGYYLINVKSNSFLEEVTENNDSFRVTNYNPDLMQKHHKRGTHEYLVNKTILDADIIFNVPKLKTHIKSGLTGALKNFIGMNGHKEYLPHHRLGSPKEDGDQYINKSLIKKEYSKLADWFYRNYNHLSKIQRKFTVFALSSLFVLSKITSKDKTLDGGWSGNDTIWRTILDLNNILYFYNTKTRRFKKKQVREVFTIVDGLICGENNGPLNPEDKFCGITIIGENPVLIDAMIAKLMGYDIKKIKQVYCGYYDDKSRLSPKRLKNINDEQIILINKTKKFKKIKEIYALNFILPEYWRDAKEK
ncbi:MAG: DUF362 domain-containing protein [archaeon]